MPAALLFDLDGTLIDTDPIHAAVFAEIFARHGKTIDAAFYTEHLHGKLNAEIFGTHFPGQDAAALAAEKEATFRDRLGTSARPMPGLPDLISRAHQEGWRLAVVTNAPRDNALAMLSAIGMERTFETLVIADDLPRGKPHPDPYRAAMETLGVAPRDCIAFEDSRSGVAAAHAAGAYTLGLRSSLDDATLRRAGADATITDFTDPALPDHLARLTGVTP